MDEPQERIIAPPTLHVNSGLYVQLMWRSGGGNNFPGSKTECTGRFLNLSVGFIVPVGMRQVNSCGGSGSSLIDTWILHFADDGWLNLPRMQAVASKFSAPCECLILRCCKRQMSPTRIFNSTAEGQTIAKKGMKTTSLDYTKIRLHSLLVHK